jgi:hypothetical protein
MATYNFTKTPVSIDRLTLEINDSSIAGVYQYASYNDPNLVVAFQDALSGADCTTLSGIVDSHTGEPVNTEAGQIAVADGEGGVAFVSPDTVTVSGGNEYPRYYIEENLNRVVNDYGQYVVQEGTLEVAGALELGTGGMLIIKQE